MKDLVMWCDDVVYTRVAHTMHVAKLPRDEAMELLVPIWDQYVRKGVVARGTSAAATGWGRCG